MSLYLDYRPKTLDDLVGQRHIIDILLAQAKANQLGHSYLLFGPRGTGKTSTARLLAKIANCITFDAEGNPDLVNDPYAKLIDNNQSLDFVEIDAASHTGVDNIREEIIDKASYPPAHLKKKVYVIDEVHMLSKGAFNALLKIMEEPPSYLMFILATTELHKVPDTIVSRCQLFNFKQLGIDEIVSRLQHIVDKEQVNAESEALRLIAKLSGGALRDAIKYLEQISILGDITESQVANFLGIVSDEVLRRCMELLLGNDATAWMNFLDDLIKQGVDLTNLTKEILLWLDEYFLEDPSNFSKLANVFREIASQSKRYPHPLLLWKSKTRMWFEEKTGNTQPVIHNTQGSTTSQQQGVSHTQSAAITVSPVLDNVGTSNNQETAPSTTTPLASSLSSSSSPLSSETIMQELIASTNNPLVKSALKQYAVVDSIHGEKISIAIINEQYYHMLTKTETSHELQKKLSEKLGYSIHLDRVQTTKEAWLLSQMS